MLHVCRTAPYTEVGTHPLLQRTRLLGVVDAVLVIIFPTCSPSESPKGVKLLGAIDNAPLAA